MATFRLLFIFSFFYTSAFAGNKTGNGGFVVECISVKKIEVLDVFDEFKTAGIKKTHLSIMNSLDENIEILISKIKKTNTELADELTINYFHFKNRMVFKENLNEFYVNDLKEDVIPSLTICWYKLAVVQRIESDGLRYYYIDEGLWRGLTDIGKSYLVLHEIYYTYLLNTMNEVLTSDEVRKFVYDISINTP